MMKERIYLIGQISVDNKATYQWRQEVREYFKEIEEPKMSYAVDFDPMEVISVAKLKKKLKQAIGKGK